MAAKKERRSFWTWGYQSDEPSETERHAAAERISKRTGRAIEPPPIPDVDAIALRSPRVKVPGKLGEFVSTSQVRRDEGVLGAEPVVERSLRDAGLSGDGVDANRVDAVAVEQLRRHLQDAPRAGRQPQFIAFHHSPLPLTSQISIVTYGLRLYRSVK